MGISYGSNPSRVPVMGEHDSEEAKVARALIFRELGPVHLGEDTVVLHGAEAQELVLIAGG